MITVLHGEDIESSYKRLSTILLSFPKHQKIRLDSKNTHEEIVQSIFGTSLTDNQRLIVIENFLTQQKKPKYDILKDISQQVEVILYEKSQLTTSKISKLPKTSKIENFKLEPKIFYFLDSIAPANQKMSLKYLFQMDANQIGLLWQIENRILLMLLHKLNFDSQKASSLVKRNIFDWQWKKIESQAKRFDTKTLLSIYNATLKIDYMKKSGQTNLKENSLINIMLLKYLTR